MFEVIKLLSTVSHKVPPSSHINQSETLSRASVRKAAMKTNGKERSNQIISKERKEEMHSVDSNPSLRSKLRFFFFKAMSACISLSCSVFRPQSGSTGEMFVSFRAGLKSIVASKLNACTFPAVGNEQTRLLRCDSVHYLIHWNPYCRPTFIASFFFPLFCWVSLFCHSLCFTHSTVHTQHSMIILSNVIPWSG